MEHLENERALTVDDTSSPTAKQPWSTPTLSDLSVKETEGGGTGITDATYSRFGLGS